MQGIKTKVTYDFIDGFIKIINELLAFNYPEFEDMMVMALLQEIKEKMLQRTLVLKKDYKIAFSPAQCFALVILYEDFLQEHNTSFMGNQLHMITNQIKQKYPL